MRLCLNNGVNNISQILFDKIFSCQRPYHTTAYNHAIADEPFVNLGIGTGIELELTLQTPLGLQTAYGARNLAGCWLSIRTPHPQIQSYVKNQPRGHVTKQKVNFVSQISQGLLTLNLAVWWFRMRGPHPKESHNTSTTCSSDKSNCFIFTFTRPMNSKLNRMVT